MMNRSERSLGDILTQSAQALENEKISTALSYGKFPPSPPPLALTLPEKHDAAAAVAFLRWLDADGWHNLWAKHPEAGANEGRTFAPGSWAEIAAYITAHEGWNIYYSVNEPKPGSPNKKLAACDIAKIRCAHVDFDPNQKLELAGEGAAERARIRKLSDGLFFDLSAPSDANIYSGGGDQVLWRFNNKLPASDFGRHVEDLNRGIVKRFGGDPAATPICQVLRLPGTINFPDAEKRKRGRVPTRAMVIHQEDDPELWSTWEGMIAWTPPIPKQGTAANKKLPEPIDMAAVGEIVEYDDLPADLRRDFEALCRKFPIVDALWRGEQFPGRDESPSGLEFALVGWLKRAGFSPTKCAQLISVYPYRSIKHEHELERRVTNAWINNKVAYGAEGFDPIEIDESKNPFRKGKENSRNGRSELNNGNAASTPASPSIFDDLAVPLEPFSADDLPEIPWVIGNFLPRQTFVQLTGAGGASKSTLIDMIAIALAAKRSDICHYPITKAQRVLILNLEDTLDQMKRRICAIMQKFGVTWDDLRDEDGKLRLHLVSGLELGLKWGRPLSLVERDPKSPGGFKPGRDLPHVIAATKEFGADLVALDPLVSAHPANESWNHEMRGVMNVLTQWPVQANCAGLLSHHFGKPDKASSQGSAGDPNAARGASAIADACRGTVTLLSMSEQDLKHWQIPEGASHLDYVRLDDARMSLCAKRRDPYWYRRESVLLAGNKRKAIGVLVPADLPARIKIGTDLLHIVAKTISEHLPTNTPHNLSAVLSYMPESETADLRGKNRVRTLDTAFGGKGVNDYMTEYGILKRTSRSGKETALTLVSRNPTSSPPQNEDEEGLTG
jgi:hypothetical protein